MQKHLVLTAMCVALLGFEAAKAQADLCSAWKTIPNLRPLETQILETKAAFVSVQFERQGKWVALPVQPLESGRYQWLAPVADPDLGGTLRLRLQLDANTTPSQTSLQTCQVLSVQVSALPATGSARGLTDLHETWESTLAGLKQELFGESYTVPEQLDQATWEELPEIIRPAVMLEFLLRSPNNLKAIADGSAPMLQTLSPEQKKLMLRLLEAAQLPKLEPLRFSPGQDIVTPPTTKRRLPDTQNLLFARATQIPKVRLYMCTQPNIPATVLRDCFRWQKEASAWNSGLYKKHAAKAMFALGAVGLLFPPAEAAALTLGVAVFLHQTMIEIYEGLLPSQLGPLEPLFQVPPIFEDRTNAPENTFPMRWEQPVVITAKTKGYQLNVLTIGDALLNLTPVGKLGEEVAIFGSELTGDLVAESLKLFLAQMGLDSNIQDALAVTKAQPTMIKAELQESDSLLVYVAPKDGTYTVESKEGLVQYARLANREGNRNYKLTFETNRLRDYFPDNRIAKKTFDLSIPELKVEVLAAPTVKPGKTTQIRVKVQNAYLKEVLPQKPKIGSLSAGEITSDGMNFEYTAPFEGAFPQIVELKFLHKTESRATGTISLTIDAEPRVRLSPSGGCVAGGSRRQFKAEVFDLKNPSVVWKIKSGTGSISTSGLYTAVKNPPIAQVVIEAVATGFVGTTRKEAKQTISFTVGKCTCFAEFSTPDGRFAGRTIYFDNSGGVLRIAGPVILFTAQSVNANVASVVQQSIIFGATLQGGRVSSNSIVVFNNLKYNWKGKQLLRSIVISPEEGADVRYTITKQTPERLEGSLSGTWVTKDFDRVEKWSEDGTTPEVWGKVQARLDFIAVRGALVANGLTVGTKDVGKCLK
jgi:hypothetical protein